MVNTNLFDDLIRYGRMKCDCDFQDKSGRFIRVCMFEFNNKPYLTVMCNGEALKCEEV